MKERPILFQGEMVRALLEERKTKTRRVVKPQPLWVYADSVPVKTEDADPKGAINCPYGKPGDRLWVRETWGLFNDWGFCDTSLSGIQQLPDGWSLAYRADHLNPIDGDGPHRPVWRPSIHMPRWASRITLEITNIRVERLQEITEQEVLAEGVNIPTDAEGNWLIDVSSKHNPAKFLNGDWSKGKLRAHFASLWESINGEGAWAENPWVWVIVFKRLDGGAA